MSPLGGALRTIIRDPDRVREQEVLSRYTTFRIGGPADFLVEVENHREITQVLSLAREQHLPTYILGNGSNLLVSDDGVRGLVLVLSGEFNTCSISGTTVRAGGGYSLAKLALQVAKAGLGGLEFACSIPGTVGAGLVINAGAHGGDLSRVVTSGRVLLPDGREAALSPQEIGFGYRTSQLQGTSTIVSEVTMGLQPADSAQVQATMQHHLEHRRATQPLNLPNAGSVFKNPPGDFAGRLIEQAGCKGLTEGGAQVSERHANFIVNLGNASARDVAGLMDRVRRVVEARFGVRLEPEVKVWGHLPDFPV